MPLKGVFTPFETAQVKKAIEYINQHYTENISAERLVEGFDLKVFRPLFRKLTGHTVHHYLLRVRLEHAQLDLEDFTLTIDQVAHRNGFSSGGRFTKTFKAHTGETPTSYRYRIITSGNHFPRYNISAELAKFPFD